MRTEGWRNIYKQSKLISISPPEEFSIISGDIFDFLPREWRNSSDLSDDSSEVSFDSSEEFFFPPEEIPISSEELQIIGKVGVTREDS